MIASRLFGKTRECFERRVHIGRCVVCGDLKTNFLSRAWFCHRDTCANARNCWRVTP